MSTVACAFYYSATCAPAHAQAVANPDVMNRIDAFHAESLIRPAEAFTGNPASMATFRKNSLSHIYATGSYLDRNRAMIMQIGKGHMLGKINASSYIHLSPSTTVWGDAGFTTGTYHDIIWNNSADYHLVGPYVLGDSVGGDLNTRRYSFSGGYAGTAGKWAWGAKASYTAAIDYRNRDPRDKIVVSDLNIEAGATYSIFNGYNAGIGGALRIYNQESDVEFYNPNNEIRAYAMTGLGNVFARFSGTSNLNTAYRGIGATATAQLHPLSGGGMFANISFTYIGISQVLRDFNNLELTLARNYNVSAFAAYTLNASPRLSIVPALKGWFHRRIGFENLFGSSVGNNYMMLGSRRNYYADHATGKVSIAAETMPSNSLSLTIRPSLITSYIYESHRSSHRSLGAIAYTPKLEVGARWHVTDKQILSVTAACEHRIAYSTSRNLQGLDLEQATAITAIHNFDMLTSNCSTIGAHAGYCHQINASMALSVKAQFARQWIGKIYHATYATLSAGLIF